MLKRSFPTSNRIGLGELKVELKLVARSSTSSLLAWNSGHQAQDVYLVIVGSRKEFVNGVEQYVPLKNPSFTTNIYFGCYAQYILAHGKRRDELSEKPPRKENKSYMEFKEHMMFEGDQMYVFSCGEADKTQYVLKLFVSVMNGNVEITMGEYKETKFVRKGFSL